MQSTDYTQVNCQGYLATTSFGMLHAGWITWRIYTGSLYYACGCMLAFYGVLLLDAWPTKRTSTLRLYDAVCMLVDPMPTIYTRLLYNANWVVMLVGASIMLVVLPWLPLILWCWFIIIIGYRRHLTARAKPLYSHFITVILLRIML